MKAPKSSHIIPILNTVSPLAKNNVRIEYKLLSLTYKVLTSNQPSYLHNLVTVQPPCGTRSSCLVTLARPSTSSSLRITDPSFQYASFHVRNQLPASLCQPCTNLSNTDSVLRVALLPLVPSTHKSHHPSLLHFHSGLETFLFLMHPSFSSSGPTLQIPRTVTDTSENIRF